MKKLFALAMMCGVMFVPGGCGRQADENKTPDRIRAEVRSMSAADIRTKIDACGEAVAARRAELTAEGEKLAKIPPDRLLGEEADRIRDRMNTLRESIRRLTANMNAYAEGLRAGK